VSAKDGGHKKGEGLQAFPFFVCPSLWRW